MSDPVRERLQRALGAAYRIERELGGGGMSRVFVADEVALQRTVVVKLLAPELAQSLSADRFRREVLVAARLQHPHVVPLLAAGEADGLLYYTMPLVEGESLRARLARTGPMPVAEVVRVLRNVADALAYAHARGVVHRDIKPDNILLGAGHALVTDFGIAKALTEAGAQATTLTMQGLALGTPAYMAPEQAAGSAAADHRTDLYALGATAYEMLAGDAPFAGRTAAAMLVAHATEAPAPLAQRRPEVPAALASLVMQCLEKDPDRRPATAREVMARLEGVGTPAPATVALPAPVPRRRWWPAAVAAVALATALVAYARRPGGADGAAAIPADAQTILVAPFLPATDDTALARVGREMALLLGTSLDEVGPIRAIDGIAAGARLRGAFTRDEAVRAARGLGARSVVVGTLARSGAAIRLDAQLVSADSATPLARFGASAAPDSLAALTDAATFDLVRQLWRGARAPTPNLAAVTTRSVPALRAFLEGERLFAEGRILDAGDAYERAIAADPAFWFAYHRASAARAWMALPRNRAYDSIFAAHVDVLPERERLFYQVSRMNATDSAPRQLEAYRRLVERYPDYWRGIFQYGDWLAHGGGRYWGTSAEEALGAFERVLLLNERLQPAWEHWFMLAGAVDSGRALRGFARLEPLLPEATRAAARDIVGRTLDSEPDTTTFFLALFSMDSVMRLIEEGRTGGFDHRYAAFAPANAGYPGTQRRLNARLRARLPGRDNEALFERGDALSWAVSGQWDSALVAARRYVALAGDSTSLEPFRLAAVAHLLGVLDASAARAARAAVREAALAGDGRSRVELAWLDGLVAVAAGDAGGVARALEAARASGDTARSFVAATLPLLARLRTEAAVADSLAKFEMARVWLPDGVDGWRIPVSYPVQRLLVARAVAQRGDTATALRLLAFVDDNPPSPAGLRAEAPVRGFAELERARLLEARGETARAAHGYRVALRRWSGDGRSPGMEPFVRQAEQGFARVSGLRETQRP